jgi:peroxiredoxin
MPFYHTLGEIRARANTHVYAVFPPAETESDKYLERHEVRTDGVVLARLDAVGVKATPTLMVVDAKGKIERAWVGTLNDAQKLEVLRTIEHGL